MNDTEQLIKDALGQLAERTPHPGPTLNALRRKRKRQRNNIFLIATAGMAAVVVLIFAGVIASDRYAPPNANDAAAALTPGGTGSLKYQPHWLPDGFAEALRAAHDGSTARVWVPADASPEAPHADGPRIQLASGQSYEGGTSQWQDTTVRGLKARVQVNGGTAVVEWKAQDTLFVQVQDVGDPRETAMRVADSVRADSDTNFQAPFTWKGKSADEFSGSSPSDWRAKATVAEIEVGVTSRTPNYSGAPTTPVTARGKQGVVVDGRVVAVQEGSLWITAISYGATKPVDELVAAVNAVEIASNFDTGWIRKK
ncbi:hypothetical protein SAMN04488564_103452 [Lentzea waywayandensis]|uniref:Uncharacterized protein n=1 Tax=Lentzea waywayandensis TaxID=84724 RepID=A0A1I6DZ83_9PSEU|nr:hypothetical protein [Lentzea waywayandensis]SFR10707.1 hypothetical protein SAMN04488564_103452 [Lentzea waywayandensis]